MAVFSDFYGTCPVCGYGNLSVRAPYSVRERGKHNNLRGRAYLRHQRQRVIAKRQYIVKHIWREASSYYFLTEDRCFASPRYYNIVGYNSYWSQSVYKKEPGRLAKHNLSCNCWICKPEKRARIVKPKYLFDPRWCERDCQS